MGAKRRMRARPQSREVLDRYAVQHRVTWAELQAERRKDREREQLRRRSYADALLAGREEWERLEEVFE